MDSCPLPVPTTKRLMSQKLQARTLQTQDENFILPELDFLENSKGELQPKTLTPAEKKLEDDLDELFGKPPSDPMNFLAVAESVARKRTIEKIHESRTVSEIMEVIASHPPRKRTMIEPPGNQLCKIINVQCAILCNVSSDQPLCRLDTNL